MVQVIDIFCHWMQNILLGNLLYERYFITVKTIAMKVTVLKPHQFAKSFCCLPKRRGQCT